MAKGFDAIRRQTEAPAFPGAIRGRITQIILSERSPSTGWSEGQITRTVNVVVGTIRIAVDIAAATSSGPGLAGLFSRGRARRNVYRQPWTIVLMSADPDPLSLLAPAIATLMTFSAAGQIHGKGHTGLQEWLSASCGRMADEVYPVALRSRIWGASARTRIFSSLTELIELGPSPISFDHLLEPIRDPGTPDPNALNPDDDRKRIDSWFTEDVDRGLSWPFRSRSMRESRPLETESFAPPPAPRPAPAPKPASPREPVAVPPWAPASTPKPASERPRAPASAFPPASMPPPPPPPDEPDVPAIGAEPGEIYRVWFGTDRERTADPHPAHEFANTRSAVPALNLGHCDVLVPKGHRFGQIRTSIFRRLFIDDDQSLSLQSISRPMSTDAFQEALSNFLAERPEATTVVYLHGYNCSFAEAAIRAAQIGFDLKVPGAMAFFSWPSKATLTGYQADEASVELSVDRFVDFLALLTAEAGTSRVDLVAHSMGTRLLARAAEKMRERGIRLGQLIYAAPDIDADLFRMLLAVESAIAEHSTLYVSHRDLALTLSTFLHGYPRVGYHPPVHVLPPMPTIEADDVDLTLLGHGYFAEAGPVLYDIILVLRGQNDPLDRPRMKRSASGLHWKLSK